jgi:hypothetical protein
MNTHTSCRSRSLSPCTSGSDRLAELARTLKAKGLNYAQVARKLGIDRQRARYLVIKDTETWKARQAARDKKMEAARNRRRADLVRETLGMSWHSFLEARRQAVLVAARDGLEPQEVLVRWGLDIPGFRPPYRRVDLKERELLYSSLKEAVRGGRPSGSSEN